MAGERLRRSRDEVQALIVASARALFAERGYAGATTREIAERAGTSEVLIFRYFGNKAGLFEEAVFAPFDRLIGEFLETHPETMADRASGNEQFVRSSYAFLHRNADLLRALAKSPPDGGGNGQPMHGLDSYFRRSAERLQLLYDREGAKADVAPDLAVRFGFGMLAAAILFEDWFFPDADPAEEEVAPALARMMFKALSPTTER